MEHLIYEGRNQSTIEKFMLIIYSIYNFALLMMADEQAWGRGVSLFMLLAVMAGWGVYIGKYKTYTFRAKFTAVMMQSSVVIYATHTEEYTRALPVFVAFIIFLGLYGIADLIYVTVVSGVIIYCYHLFVLGSVTIQSLHDFGEMSGQIGNLILVQYVVYIWAKRNKEGSLQLLGTIEELKAAENSKDDFLANVSHEIRTPINTICGMSEILLHEELPINIKENVHDIQLAGRNLMSVVGDMLDFSELQSGKMEVEEEAYNITSTINDIISMTMARKQDKKIEIIVDCDANIPCVLLGDEKKIRRVIMNLVDNAIKFTEEGCISISIGFRRESYGINLVVAVKDTGIGMEEESLEKLFTGFNQIDSSRKRQEGGLGLGLAISHALVQKMGGALTVRSKKGKGSTIQFVVPQKVLDEAPIAAIENRENINVAVYIDMEQFRMETIRDEYTKNISHMVEQLKGKCHICRNAAELQRREYKEHFSHIFISIVEYKADKEYFDELAIRTTVIVVIDREDEKYVTNPRVLKIYKPFYILTIVSSLNGLMDARKDEANFQRKFVTRNVHVLAVDDNRMNLRVIEGMLETYEIKVTTASGGQDALDKIISANYDFVFMDHMMPEMDGVETLHRIRHKVGTYFQKVPIVALTANAVAGTREMLLAEGFDDFLEKPIERSVLERVLKRNVAEEKIIYKTEAEEALQSEEKAMVNEMKTETEKNVVEEGIQAASVEQFLESLEIDVKKGIVYCNGRTAYLAVLKGYCEDCKDSGLLAQSLFEKEEWKNYTIEVHGMKSAMRSVGAMKISDIAAKLEAAGKEGRIDYIREHHHELMEEYRKLFERLRESEWFAPQKDAKEEKVERSDKGELLILEDAEFERMIEAMEDAMYDLDGERLSESVSELQKYQYNGTSLAKVMLPVKRKVEMSDYVSAVEMVVRLKNGLSDKG